MAGKTGIPESAEAEPAAELRGTLIKRLAVAGGLVAVLLGVLAFFDYLAAPEEAEAPVYTEPVPVPPKKEISHPVKTAESLPEPPRPEAAPEKPPAPAVEAAPRTETTAARPEAEAIPAKAGAKTAAPAAPAAPPLRPAAQPPVQPASQPATAPPAVQPPAKAPGQTPPPRPAPAAVPEATASPEVKLPQDAAPVPTAKLVPQAPTRLVTGYIVQAGAFTSVQKAEELHAKLTLNGIPSTLEARVHVGPFKNKAQAAEARAKLKALGVEGVVVPPARGGR